MFSVILDLWHGWIRTLFDKLELDHSSGWGKDSAITWPAEKVQLSVTCTSSEQVAKRRWRWQWQKSQGTETSLLDCHLITKHRCGSSSQEDILKQCPLSKWWHWVDLGSIWHSGLENICCRNGLGIHLFIQQILIACLLYARPCRWWDTMEERHGPYTGEPFILRKETN